MNRKITKKVTMPVALLQDETRRTIVFQGIGEELKEQSEMTLFIFDIQSFGEINKLFGHSRADEILVGIYLILDDFARTMKGVAHWIDGGLFSYSCPQIVDHETAVKFVKKFERKVHQREQLEEGTIKFNVGFAYRQNGSGSFTELYACATSALKLLKVDTSCSVLQGEMEQINLVKQRTELKKALLTRTVQMYVQAKYDLNTRKIVGVENLLRWNHPSFGYMAPDAILSMAQNCGVMPELTEYLIRTAFEVHSKLVKNGYEGMFSVNMSAKQMMMVDVIGIFGGLMERYGVSKGIAEIELTEDEDIFVEKGLLKRLHDLGELGVALAIDDFGTGYCNFKTLQDLPFGAFKVDKSFVKDVLQNDVSLVFISTSVKLAELLDRELVVEGIETIEQERKLLEMGVVVGQGYLFARPLQIDEFIEVHMS